MQLVKPRHNARIIARRIEQHAEAIDPPELLGARGCAEEAYRAIRKQQDQVATPHSITSSARARIEGGTVRPSDLAVWRLMTSSNLVGC